MATFNELNVDLNDEITFPASIYNQTLDNPNPAVSVSCRPSQDSLDEYANRLADEILDALEFEPEIA